MTTPAPTPTPTPSPSPVKARIDLTQPRYDQSTYLGRAKHFFATTDPRTILSTTAEQDAAKKLVHDYQAGLVDASESELWKAKVLVDATFHPDTGERLFLPGRMSFQVPGNMFIVGGMLTWYRSTPAVVLWQTINQSFNAVVNFTNRNASHETSNTKLAVSFFAATSTAVATAVGMNKFLARWPNLASGLVGRFVPLAAIGAANFVNIPLMRNSELQGGIMVQDRNGVDYGMSKTAAQLAIGQVIVSRIIMAMPGTVITPLVMNKWEKGWLKTRPALIAPVTILLVGATLVFATPLACALFPQKAGVSATKLEKEFQDRGVDTYYYNKGL